MSSLLVDKIPKGVNKLVKIRKVMKIEMIQARDLNAWFQCVITSLQRL
jgi:hypothetical protein